MLNRKIFKPLALACLLALSAGAAAQTPYDEGQKALRQQDWLAAAEHFEEAFDSDLADAAMYWRAHALYKAGRRGDAQRQARMLERRYPDSDWVREAQALQIEHGGSGEESIEEDELKLFALHQLMEKDRERALPHAEAALAIDPAHPGNRLLMARTLLDVAPERRGEALAILEALDGVEPRPGERVEDLSILRNARERLAEERRRDAGG